MRKSDNIRPQLDRSQFDALNALCIWALTKGYKADFGADHRLSLPGAWEELASAAQKADWITDGLLAQASQAAAIAEAGVALGEGFVR